MDAGNHCSVILKRNATETETESKGNDMTENEMVNTNDSADANGTPERPVDAAALAESTTLEQYISAGGCHDSLANNRILAALIEREVLHCISSTVQFAAATTELHEACELVTPTASPSITPSHSPTPSITPSKSITPTPTTTPSVSITVTPSHSPSHTPSNTPAASTNNCDTWVFIATNPGGTGVVTARLCGFATNTNYVFVDGQTFCIVNGTTPSATDGTVSLLNLGC